MSKLPCTSYTPNDIHYLSDIINIFGDRNSEMTETEFAWFHMWFTPTEDGWPKALIELADGRMICVGFRRVIFNQDYVLNTEVNQ